MPLDSFFKLSAEDPESQCNILPPLAPRELEREINPRTGRVMTKDDITAAKQAFTRIANARDATVGVCCDPSSNYQTHDSQILADLRAKYPSVRVIERNGEIVELELSRVKKPVSKGWRQLSPYLVCRIMNSTLRDDPDDTDIIRATRLTKDCYSENCDATDGLTLEALFGSMPDAELEYTYFDDSRAARAVLEGDISYVREYLAKYNKVNQMLTHNDYRERLLHIAARAGYTEDKHKNVLDLILAVRPNLDVRNYEGNTPLHVAAKHGQINAAHRLLKYGGTSKAGINRRNNRGETPLMLAVGYNSPTHAQDTIDGRTSAVFVSMARLLYNNGASVLDVDNEGNNILHHIILNSPSVSEKSRLLRYFIERGANAEQQNNAGLTPLAMTGNIIGDYEEIEPIPEDPNAEEAAKWVEGFKNHHHQQQHNSNTGQVPSANNNMNQVASASNDIVVDDNNVTVTTRNDITIKTRPNNIKDPRLRELLEIQTILFNNHIRQNPDKYRDKVSVSEIPRGAPLVIRNYACSADGSSDNPSMVLQELDTRDDCEANGGHWVKVTKPTTMVQLKLIEEGESHIDAVDQALYMDKYPTSSTYKPLPDEVQLINTEIRNKAAQNNVAGGQLGSNSDGKARSRTMTGDGREGFEDMTGEYVSRGPMSELFNNITTGDNMVDSSTGRRESHPGVCGGYKEYTEMVNARQQTQRVLSNEIMYSDNIARLGKLFKDNYVLIIVLVLLMFILLWQLGKCKC